MSHIAVSSVVPAFQLCVPVCCKLQCVASRTADISDGTLVSPWSLDGFQSWKLRNVNSTCVCEGRRGVQDIFLSVMVSTDIDIYKLIRFCSMKVILWRLQLIWVNKISVLGLRKTLIVFISKTEASRSVIRVYEVSSLLKCDAVAVNNVAIFQRKLRCSFSVCNWS